MIYYFELQILLNESQQKVEETKKTNLDFEFNQIAKEALLEVAENKSLDPQQIKNLSKQLDIQL